MSTQLIEYLELGAVDSSRLMALLNSPAIRTHLVQHELFRPETITEWVASKQAMDAEPGCRVRAVVCDNELAGWCGIQFEDGYYEIAIVIDQAFWGVGVSVFRDIMTWASALGHREIYMHLRHTRPEYRFLNKMARSVVRTRLLGEAFTRYQFTV